MTQPQAMNRLRARSQQLSLSPRRGYVFSNPCACCGADALTCSAAHLTPSPSPVRRERVFSVKLNVTLCRKLCRKLCRTMPPPTKFPTKFPTKEPGSVRHAKQVPTGEGSPARARHTFSDPPG